MYITMRHLFNRGFYKPMGVSGKTLRESLLLLRPEIYGSVADQKTELNGLTYVIDRLPKGIEECQYINLTADEGYGNQGSHQALEEAANPFGSQNVGAHFPDLVARALFVVFASNLQPRLDQIQRISNHRARHPRREPERSNECRM